LRESGVRVITRDPADYRWSSYRVNAIGIESELCTPYEIYCALGDDADRLAAYRALFAALISTMNRSVTSAKPRVAAKRWAMKTLRPRNGGPYRHAIACGQAGAEAQAPTQ